MLSIGNGWYPQEAGGLERMYYHLHRELPAHGVETTGIVVGRPIPDLPTVHTPATVTAPLGSRLRGMRQAVNDHLSDVTTDAVASHFALYAFPVLDLLQQRPFITHFHGPWAAESAANNAPRQAVEQVKFLIERAVYQRADRCIVLSEAFGQVLMAQYGVAPERVRCVPGGVDVDVFAVDGTPADARQRLTWPQDRPLVLAVRRLVPRMGLEQLIDAIATVRKAVPDVLALIAGKGPLREQLQERIATRGLQHHVRLLGFVPEADLPYAYRAATVTIVPTVSLEGFGLITLESMAAGTPPLVTPVGGLPEAVSALSSELVLEGASAQAIADGLAAALQGRRPLPSPAACVAHVRAHHDWPVIARRVAKVYREVVPV